MFILSAQRENDTEAAFKRYREYLADNKSRFPAGAYGLAISDWYFDFSRHDCPHDAWLEQMTVEESSSGERHDVRSVAIIARLLGAYHDGIIEIRYPRVYDYRFSVSSVGAGHGDWRYDEFRVSDSGQLIHEIEWWGARSTGSWLIVADDIEFRWTPTR